MAVGAALLWLIASPDKVKAGGSGLNLVVVVNRASANSCELGNYYCERRRVPSENVLRVNWPGNVTTWTSDDFQNVLLNPLLAMLSARSLTSQIDYVVLSMDLPYQTVFGSSINSTTAALFYGWHSDMGPSWAGITNSYAWSEQSFADAHPASALGYSFLTTMLTASSPAQAKAIVDRGVASDGTFPVQPIMLAKSSDTARNIRYKLFNNAHFNAQLCGAPSIYQTNLDSLWGQGQLMGLETGLAYFSIPAGTFTPGAMADSLTSYGGLIFGGTDQTTLLAFINAGASGSYGTVTEPSAILAKFPDPQTYFYQSRGFALAECYYQSLFEPYEGLIVAEPLAAPFQITAQGQWTGMSSNALLRGSARLAMDFYAADAKHPLQQVDLFMDGKFFRTLSSIRPRAGNIMHVTLDGYPIDYTIPPNASLPLVASGLADSLNAPAINNITKVIAIPHGDRVELRSTSTNRAAESKFFTDSTAGAGPRFYRAVYLDEAAPPQLALNLSGTSRTPQFHIETPPLAPCVLLASTNLVNWIPILTNLAGRPLEFLDLSAKTFARRFYRAAFIPPAPPVLTVLTQSVASGVLLRLDRAVRPFVLQACSDLTHWVPIHTNSAPDSVEAVVSTRAGSASTLSSFASLSRNFFLDSPAHGLRSFSISGILNLGDWVALDVAKLDGSTVHVAVTNQIINASLYDFSQILAAQINSTAELHGRDGIEVDDLQPSWFGSAILTLAARTCGLSASRMAVTLTSSSGPWLSPVGTQTLDENLSDLQPRNHLYVSAGTNHFSLNVALDTTTLSDGYHDFTAVAYEGTSVRTQTRISLPVRIQNSTLSATISLLDLPDSASVQGTYHIQVIGNTSPLKSINLSSSGGVVGTVTNQSSATFTIIGSQLGVGRHPVYAEIESAAGLKYRTETHWFRLVP